MGAACYPDARKKSFVHDEEAFLAGYDFTTRVRGALIKARDEAHRRHHDYVGTEHLLFGLLAEDDALVMDVLENLGARASQIEAALDGMVRNGEISSHPRIQDLPYTPRARVVLDQAIATAHEFGDGYVGTQHLLLGLIRERTGLAAQALTASGMTEPMLRREIVRLLQGEGVAAALDIGASDQRRETQVPLSIAVEVRYEDGTLAKKIFTSPDEAIGFLRDKSRD
ncbi:MAG TPA: Clp protease N-terminal domain-containing protein [Gemmatimonadaceae bacterium]